MNIVKTATADVTEKVQNVKAKVDEKLALNKASKVAKAEEKAAEGKAAKHDAKANYYAKQAEIVRNFDNTKANNAALKEEKKAALHGGKVDKNVDNAAAVSPDTPANRETSAQVDQTYPDQPLDTSLEPNTPQEGFQERNIDDPASTDAAGPAANQESLGDTYNAPDSADASSPVDQNQVPMHGSGVPTHSTLHGDEHDAQTTQTMGGTPNNGSYM